MFDNPSDDKVQQYNDTSDPMLGKIGWNKRHGDTCRNIYTNYDNNFNNSILYNYAEKTSNKKHRFV